MTGQCGYHKPTICSVCKVENGTIVTRRKDNPKVWALDLDLAKEYPETWTKPRTTHVMTGGRCTICAEGLCRSPP